MSTKPNFHIIGPGCGGTSLLAGLLDFNSHIEVGFELGAMKHLYGFRRRPHPVNWWRLRMFRYHQMVEQAASCSTKLLFANKITTEQLGGLLIQSQPFDSISNSRRLKTVVKYLFQGQRLVLVMRDARTCIPSKMKRGGHDLKESVFRWQRSVILIHQLQLSPVPSMLLRYEDLVSRPDHSLRRLCDFVGVPFNDEMLNGTTNPKMHPRYRSTRLALPEASFALPPSVVTAISEQLSLFGYDPSNPT